MIPETRPGLFGNQSQPWCIGTIYVRALVSPKPPAKSSKNNQKDLTTIDMKFRLQPIMTPAVISLKIKIKIKDQSIDRKNLKCKDLD